MRVEDPGAAWQGYALTGRPDFLNYLHRGDVSWSDLWRFYGRHEAEADAVLRLSGLFHIFMSQEYEHRGSVLDRDTDLFAGLVEWAGFAVEQEERIEEERLRDSLATLLGQSLICPLYYEAVFSMYVEASLRRHVNDWASDLGRLRALAAEHKPGWPSRRMALHLTELPPCPTSEARDWWEKGLSVVVDRHFAAWDDAYTLALGDEDEGWRDEGGSE
jgi:hypothetical protein